MFSHLKMWSLIYNMLFTYIMILLSFQVIDLSRSKSQKGYQKSYCYIHFVPAEIFTSFCILWIFHFFYLFTLCDPFTCLTSNLTEVPCPEAQLICMFIHTLIYKHLTISHLLLHFLQIYSLLYLHSSGIEHPRKSCLSLSLFSICGTTYKRYIGKYSINIFNVLELFKWNLLWVFHKHCCKCSVRAPLW